MWVAAGAVLSLIAIGAGWILLQPDSLARTREQLVAARAGFPLYCLKALPDGATIPNNSVATHEGVVMFTLDKGANHITVSQQARPKFMEEVEKVKEVAVPAGKAYVAKLNTRTVGFLVTDKTLVIVSSIQPMDTDTTAAILENFVAL